LKSLGSLLRQATGLHETPIPGFRLARVQQVLKRRLDDDIMDVFDRACASDELDAAADLLAMLEKRHAVRAATYGRERRISDSTVLRARRDFERVRALHDRQAAMSATDPKEQAPEAPATIS